MATDGLPPGEGAFLPCSFWLADNYALMGRQAEAKAMFENLLALRNDLGLLSEEYDPRVRRLTGNFPQAFSHLAIVNTALSLRDEQAAKKRGVGAEPGRRRRTGEHPALCGLRLTLAEAMSP